MWHRNLALRCDQGRCGRFSFFRRFGEQAAAYERQCSSSGNPLHKLLELELDRVSTPSEYALLLRKCGSVKAVEVGKLVHTRIHQCSSDMGIGVENMLVEMYGKCKRADSARQVFDNMAIRNPLSWSIMIAAYAQNGHYSQALEIFRMMVSDGLRPDRVTCIAILDACGVLGNLELAKWFHEIVVECGYEEDVVVGTAVMTMYNKCGSIQDARQMFDKMPVRNVVSWSAIIAAYARKGYSAEALQLFVYMEHEGVKANEITFVSVLDACSCSGALRQGQMIHERVRATGALQFDVILGNALVHMYGKCRRIELAKEVFEGMERKNAVTWNTLIAACSRHELFCKEAFNLLGRMDLEGFKPNEITYVSVIDACASSEALVEGQVLHDSIAFDGLDTGYIVGNALINLYGKCGKLKAAARVLEGIQARDKISWTTLLAAYAQHGFGERAFRLLMLMDHEGIKPDRYTFVKLIESCISIVTTAAAEKEAEVSPQAMALGEEVYDRLVDSGIQLDCALQTALVNMYGRCGNPDAARREFDRMSLKKDVAVWNSLLAAYLHRGQGKEALELFYMINLEGVKPDKVTFLGIFEACSILAALGHARLMHARMWETGLQSDVLLSTALINMYAKCGSLADAKEEFEKSFQGDVVTWSAMVAAYSQFGLSEEALHCFHQMQQEGVKPDSVSFVSIISGCSHSGLVEAATDFFTSLKQDYGIEPTEAHYGCFIDLLSRAGRLREAERFLRKMPCKSYLTTWMTLLKACRTYGDLKRARKLAVKLCQLKPSAGPPYRLLAMIFRLNRKWDSVKNPSKSSIERGILKHPGCSWIEVGNRVYQFFIEDEAHLPREHEIISELQRLTVDIRKVGYVRDPLKKVHELNEREKKFMLAYHSEKLAVVFGLLSTPPGTPLRVVKNVGICNDCHSMIKFISKLEGREIIVRDNMRFHQFRDGSCSCRDQL